MAKQHQTKNIVRDKLFQSKVFIECINNYVLPIASPKLNFHVGLI